MPPTVYQTNLNKSKKKKDENQKILKKEEIKINSFELPWYEDDN